MAYVRPQAVDLERRLAEPRRFIIAVVGPRQIGKTTLVQHVTRKSGLTTRFVSADEPTLRSGLWLEQQWEAARIEAQESGRSGSVLVLDEIQKIPNWFETVKRLWDRQTRDQRYLAPARVLRGNNLTQHFRPTCCNRE